MALTKAQLVDLNANELIVDLDGDTSITVDTDDQIDIKIAGVDDFRFTANTFTALFYLVAQSTSGINCFYYNNWCNRNI